MIIEVNQYSVILKNEHELYVIFCYKKDNVDFWKIKDGSFCLTKNLEWIKEPLPSERDDNFLNETRFTLADCKEILCMYEDANI